MVESCTELFLKEVDGIWQGNTAKALVCVSMFAGGSVNKQLFVLCFPRTSLSCGSRQNDGAEVETLRWCQ